MKLFRRIVTSGKGLLCHVLILLLLTTVTGLSAQNNNTVFRVRGIVSEQSVRGATPLQYAAVGIESYGLYTTSAADGSFDLENVPVGKVELSIRSLGKVSIDTLINVASDLFLSVTMVDDNFRLREVIVTAQTGKAGQSTASLISRSAMDHLQATSLTDIMSLLPGNLTNNPTLSYLGRINIRSIGTGSSATAAQDMNSSGVLLLADGAPISNDANMNTTGVSTYGTVSSLGGNNGPGAGVDTRSISTDNIESVEVIQGIASVEYGDATSGVVIIKTKAGREPLRVNARLNPQVYMFSVGAGYEFGKKAGALNINADHALNYRDLISQYATYSRSTAKLTYFNSLFNNTWRTNTSFSYLNGVNKVKQNPDDMRTHSRSAGNDNGFTLNTNGTIYTRNAGWLRNIAYTLSGTYTSRKSFSEADRNTRDYSYSGTTTDGTILSNKPGENLYDANGNRITNFGQQDAGNYALWIRDAFLGRQDVDGKEINLFGKVNATFSKTYSQINNKVLVGMDFSSDGNKGKGVTFPYDKPIPSPLAAQNPYQAYRSRAFKDVPFVNNFGAYIEENFDLILGNKRHFRLQAGLRYDNVSVAGGLLQPRVNASIDLFPWLALKGGFGISAKKPSLMYLYPEKAYYEIQNLNTIPLYLNSPNDQHLITTTRVFDTQNKGLQLAQKNKSELGLDFRFKNYRTTITYFRERMDNGYKFSNTFDTYQHIQHQRYNYDPSTGKISERDNLDVLIEYYTPSNNLVDHTDGVEYTLDLPRYDVIRTAFSINGAWMRTASWDKGYTFYNRTNGVAESNRSMGVYDKAMEKYYFERFVTSLRAIHNIPEVGLVISLTAEITWKEANWYSMGNDSIPIKYISKTDGKIYDFPYTNTIDVPKGSEYADMMRSVNRDRYICENKPPLVCFNINVTKEVGDYVRISFFANNMFRSYPIYKVKRTASGGSNFETRNPPLFFGMELSVNIK